MFGHFFLHLFLIFGVLSFFLSFLWFALFPFENILDPNLAIIFNLLELSFPKRQADMV